MRYKRHFWTKIALSHFISIIAVALLCIALLFGAIQRKAASINQELNEENLLVTKQNIEKMLDRVEDSAVSIFFDKDVKNGVLARASNASAITTYNQTYSNLLRVLNTTAEIQHILIYSKGGFKIATCADSAVPFHDYDSCMRTLSALDPSFSEDQASARWFAMENTGTGLAGRHWLVNARILRDTNTLAPTAVMLIYMKEMSLARMYSFFSDDICIVDEAGTILSASDASRIGSKGPDAGGAASRIRIYIPGLRAYLVAEPDASLFNDVRANALAVCAILCAVCAVISLIYAVWISRGLTRPINALVETMQAAPSTGFRQKYGGSESDEIGYLGDAFNGMLDDIRRYVADIEAAQRRTRNSEVKFLQAQINPHLLYNTLDTVEYYVSRHENQIASDILHSLSGYFKSSLRQGRDFVPLSDEVENIRGYMELQRLCRGKDIKLELDIPLELMALPILRITLQPVVENAYLHAFLGTLDDGVIEIRAASAGGDDILIRVSDNGIGMDEAALQQTREAVAAENCEGRSFGLWNLNRRLKACYGTGYGIEVDSCFGEYTRVTIRVARREGGLECIG